MPGCGYVEKCWFRGREVEKDYMEGELKGISTNSGTCAGVSSLGTPSCARQCMEMHFQNYLPEYAVVYICCPTKCTIAKTSDAKKPELQESPAL